MCIFCILHILAISLAPPPHTNTPPPQSLIHSTPLFTYLLEAKKAGGCFTGDKLSHCLLFFFCSKFTITVRTTVRDLIEPQKENDRERERLPDKLTTQVYTINFERKKQKKVLMGLRRPGQNSSRIFQMINF